MIVLEDVADPLVAEPRLLAAVEGVEIGAVDADGAFFRVFETGERVKQRGLPRPARAAEEDLLAAMDAQVDAVQHLDGLSPDSVAAVQVDGFDDHVAHAGERAGTGSGTQARESR